VAALFTRDGVWRMPKIPVELAGREEIRAWGDAGSGRAYIQELIRLRDRSSELNYAIYHDRYRRTPDGWELRAQRSLPPVHREQQLWTQTGPLHRHEIGSNRRSARPIAY
jgi:hypothetical protein